MKIIPYQQGREFSKSKQVVIKSYVPELAGNPLPQLLKIDYSRGQMRLKMEKEHASNVLNLRCKALFPPLGL